MDVVTSLSANASLLSVGSLQETGRTSCLFNSLQFFLERLALGGIEAAAACFDSSATLVHTPSESEEYSRAKCDLILRLFRFLSGMLNVHPKEAVSVSAVCTVFVGAVSVSAVCTVFVGAVSAVCTVFVGAVSVSAVYTVFVGAVSVSAVCTVFVGAVSVSAVYTVFVGAVSVSAVCTVFVGAVSVSAVCTVFVGAVSVSAVCTVFVGYIKVYEYMH